jgi:hypothetical protein
VSPGRLTLQPVALVGRNSAVLGPAVHKSAGDSKPPSATGMAGVQMVFEVSLVAALTTKNVSAAGKLRQALGAATVPKVMCQGMGTPG